MALASPGSRLSGYGIMGSRAPLGASGALAGWQTQNGGSNYGSPGVSPMAQLAAGSGAGASPNSRLGTSNGVGVGGSTPGVGGGAGGMSNQFQFTPEQYSQDVEGSYADQLSQNAKDATAAQGIANNYQAALQRRNSSNAAIGGYSVGGGGFLAGQAGAGMEGLANAQDIARKYSDQAVGIRQHQADYRAGVDSRNTQRAGDLAYQDYVYNRGRTDQLSDKKTEADATSFGNAVTTAAQGYAAKLGQYGIVYADGKGSGVGWAEAAPLMDALKNAKTPADLASAQAALDAFLAKRGQARSDFRAGDQGGDNESTYLKNMGW